MGATAGNNTAAAAVTAAPTNSTQQQQQVIKPRRPFHQLNSQPQHQQDSKNSTLKEGESSDDSTIISSQASTLTRNVLALAEAESPEDTSKAEDAATAEGLFEKALGQLAMPSAAAMTAAALPAAFSVERPPRQALTPVTSPPATTTTDNLTKDQETNTE